MGSAAEAPCGLGTGPLGVPVDRPLTLVLVAFALAIMVTVVC